MDWETKVNETNEMLEIYGNIDELAVEEAMKIKEDLEEKKQSLEEILNDFYKDPTTNAGRISSIESTMNDLDELLKQVSEIAEPEQEENGLSDISDEEPETKDDELIVEEFIEENPEEILPEAENNIALKEPSKEFIESAKETVAGRSDSPNLLGVVEQGGKTAEELMKKIQQSENGQETEAEKVNDYLLEEKDYDKDERVK